MGVIGQATFLYALINQIVLHPDDEEYLYAVPKIHQERIEVTAVADDNAFQALPQRSWRRYYPPFSRL